MPILLFQHKFLRMKTAIILKKGTKGRETKKRKKKIAKEGDLSSSREYKCCCPGQFHYSTGENKDYYSSVGTCSFEAVE